MGPRRFRVAATGRERGALRFFHLITAVKNRSSPLHRFLCLAKKRSHHHRNKSNVYPKTNFKIPSPKHLTHQHQHLLQLYTTISSLSTHRVMLADILLQRHQTVPFFRYFPRSWHVITFFFFFISPKSSPPQLINNFLIF